jgi:hypothetical protein
MLLPHNSERSHRCGPGAPLTPRLSVTICTDHHKGGLGEAFGLEPRLAATGAIGCQRMFGDDPLKLSLCTCFKQGSTIAVELIAELDAALLIGAKQSL